MLNSDFLSSSPLLVLLFKISGAFLFALFLSWALSGLVSLFVKKGGKSGWLSSLLGAIRVPLKWLIFGLALVFSLDCCGKHFSWPFALKELTHLFLLIIATWIAFRWKKNWEMHLAKRYQNAPHDKRAIVTAIDRFLTVLILAIAFLTLLEILHIPIAALLAFGGVGGLAIGWAAQGLISNIFGGLMIYTNRHFSIGDWIRSPNKDFEGIVEEIGWFQTKVRSLDRRPTYIPNSLLTDAIIENPGRMYNRRVKQPLFFDYKDIHKIGPLVKALEVMLKKHPDVDHLQAVSVNFMEYTHSALEVEVYCFTKATKLLEYREALQNILLSLADVVEKHGVSFAYPTSIIYNK